MACVVLYSRNRNTFLLNWYTNLYKTPLFYTATPTHGACRLLGIAESSVLCQGIIVQCPASVLYPATNFS